MKLFHFHKWKYVRKYYVDELEGVEFENYYHPYRICTKCGKTEVKDPIFGWEELNKVRAKVLRSLIVDKGGYYELRIEKNED